MVVQGRLLSKPENLSPVDFCRHQFECIHPYNACKQFDSGLLQKVGVLIVVFVVSFLLGTLISCF